jgi:5-methylcytosine-specific restriction protein A
MSRGTAMSVGQWILMCMMNSLLDRLSADVEALRETWAGAAPAFDGGVGERELTAFSGPGLVRVLEVAARLRREVDAMVARVADEVASRSTSEFGADGLAKQHGHASAARLLAAATGGAAAEASRLIAVGEATRERTSFVGELLPAKFEHVRAALHDGAVSVEAAAAITAMLRRVEVRADPNLLGPYEQKLVEVAAGAPLSLVLRAVKLAEARLDADGAAPADERLFDDRSLTFHEDAHGVFHLRARLDPVTAAPVKAALDALVSDALRRRQSGRATDAHHPSVIAPGSAAGAPQAPNDERHSVGTPSGFSDHLGPAIEDRRSLPQLQADALSQLADHALGCAGAPGTLPKTTVVVRMSLEALRDGLGLAEIDGVDRPVAASTVRKLAADAELVPLVLGADSAPLDLGRSTRLFTRAQRLALMERDGGCASCGANITYADAHHIDWWSRDAGSTDLSNGVMLCSHCHHQVHDHGWGIRADAARVWFIPPPHIDPRQHPRLGGRARFDPTPDPPGSQRGSGVVPCVPVATREDPGPSTASSNLGVTRVA